MWKSPTKPWFLKGVFIMNGERDYIGFTHQHDPKCGIMRDNVGYSS